MSTQLDLSWYWINTPVLIWEYFSWVEVCGEEEGGQRLLNYLQQMPWLAWTSSSHNPSEWCPLWTDRDTEWERQLWLLWGGRTEGGADVLDLFLQIILKWSLVFIAILFSFMKNSWICWRNCIKIWCGNIQPFLSLPVFKCFNLTGNQRQKQKQCEHKQNEMKGRRMKGRTQECKERRSFRIYIFSTSTCPWRLNIPARVVLPFCQVLFFLIP